MGRIYALRFLWGRGQLTWWVGRCGLGSGWFPEVDGVQVVIHEYIL
jgi:hypothetical protein